MPEQKITLDQLISDLETHKNQLSNFKNEEGWLNPELTKTIAKLNHKLDILYMKRKDIND